MKGNGTKITVLYCRLSQDDGYSGMNFQRPSFQRMIADIENGKIEVHNPVMVNGLKEQKLTVYYKFVGQID